MATLKPLTLLHSNDLHGDLLAENRDSRAIGGISLLSGYVQKVRSEEQNVAYCIAGDMLQGSLIDAEFKGLSTIDVMNLLNPDVASLGNHETDYGLAHLLFLERCARFPLVNANFFIKHPHTRLFSPYLFVERDGMRIMFIGIITNDVMAGIKIDSLYSSLVDVNDAAREVGQICNAWRTTDVDLTVLLTHIGFDEDKKLAALLDPRWGVDLIIGGHSHTVLEQPVVVHNILSAQAGVGTDQRGRVDLMVDTDSNSVASWQWQLVPIDNQHCPGDAAIETILSGYKDQTDEKYQRILCRLPQVLTHPSRYQETALGSFITDVYRDCFGVDIALIGSGSVRRKEAGPVITLGDLMEILPYHEGVYRYLVTGVQLKHLLKHILREEAFNGGYTEFFQFSHGLKIVWSQREHDFAELWFEGQPVEDDALYSLALEAYHRNNSEDSLGLALEELVSQEPEVCLSTSEQDVLVEFFSANISPRVPEAGRLVLVN
jgi:5'-nucleotidase